MDYSKLLIKYYQNNQWICGNTYESIEWKETKTPKPTNEHLENLWNELLKDDTRKERYKSVSET
jgi:hypothetical protein